MAAGRDSTARLLTLARAIPDLPASFLQFLESAESAPQSLIEEMVDNYLVERLEVDADGELTQVGKRIDELVGKLMLIAIREREHPD